MSKQSRDHRTNQASEYSRVPSQNNCTNCEKNVRRYRYMYYECEVCLRKFRKAIVYEAHLSDHENNELVYKCEHPCTFMFKKWLDLYCHRINGHAEKVSKKNHSLYLINPNQAIPATKKRGRKPREKKSETNNVSSSTSGILGF